MQKLVYPLSLLTLAVAMFLLVNYPESGRMNMIAGALITIGFILNIIGYILMRGRQVKV